MCDPTSPCGGILVEDRAFNHDLAQFPELTQRARVCLNGHRHYTGLPSTAPPPPPERTVYCREHGQPRPCPHCAERGRRLRLAALARRAPEAP